MSWYVEKASRDNKDHDGNQQKTIRRHHPRGEVQQIHPSPPFVQNIATTNDTTTHPWIN
jgi:hypothetical protein